MQTIWKAPKRQYTVHRRSLNANHAINNFANDDNPKCDHEVTMLFDDKTVGIFFLKLYNVNAISSVMLAVNVEYNLLQQLAKRNQIII